MNQIGKNVQAARMRKGLTAKQLGKQSGVSETFILDLESGRKIANEAILKRLAQILEANFYTDLGDLADSEPQEVRSPAVSSMRNSHKEPISKEKPTEQWEMAFSNVMRKIPIYDFQTWTVKDQKLEPVVNNKIDGYAPDKIQFMLMSDDSLRTLGIKSGDVIKLAAVRDIHNNGVYLVSIRGKRVIRRIRKLDGEKLLLMELSQDNKTDVVSVKEVEILGKCLSAEIRL